MCFHQENKFFIQRKYEYFDQEFSFTHSNLNSLSEPHIRNLLSAIHTQNEETDTINEEPAK